MRLGGCLAFALLLMGTTGCNDEIDTSAPEGTGGSGSGGGGAVDDGEPALPEATGVCPDFVDGDVTFAPAGIPPRAVRLFLDAEAMAASEGPLVFYWHGWGSNPLIEPPYGLGEAQNWVKDAGGVIAAPHSDPASGQFPWYLVTGGDNESDLILADEVVACAIEKAGIDPHRIHSIGMSAGGLQTTQMSYRRSGYLASVVTYSGGLLSSDLPVQDETNLFPAMMFHGGPNDIVVLNFMDLTEAYHADLQTRGHFSFICNHGQEHNIPKSDNEQASVRAFFEAHPWGTTASPYQDGLPEGFPSYCAL